MALFNVSTSQLSNRDREANTAEKRPGVYSSGLYEKYVSIQKKFKLVKTIEGNSFFFHLKAT